MAGTSSRESLLRIIARKTLQEFWEGGHADAEQPLRAWLAEASRAEWQTPADIKSRYPHASIVDAERVVFNIGGNKYRLVAKVWFAGQAVYVKFIGTHGEYDAIDVSQL